MEKDTEQESKGKKLPRELFEKYGNPKIKYRLCINNPLCQIKMKKLAILSSILLAALVGCNKSKPIVVLDNWYDVEYAKASCESAKKWQKENATLINQFGCEKVTSCPEMMPIVEACSRDPVQEVQTFEDNLAREFAVNQTCRSVHFVYFKNSDKTSKSEYYAMKEQHWWLKLDFKPGAKIQNWSMVLSGERSAFLQGWDSPKEIARKVCSIAKERGASIEN